MEKQTDKLTFEDALKGKITFIQLRDYRINEFNKNNTFLKYCLRGFKFKELGEK